MTRPKATEYIDNFLMKEYNVNNVEQLKRIGYSSLLGEREAENAAERLALNVSDRRTNYPDYERGAITYQTYSGSAKSGNIMGQSIPEATAFARYADEDIRKGVAGNAKRETENAQFNGKMDGRRSLLGADRVRTAGNEPAFSLPLEGRVSGDALLDAQDFDEVVNVRLNNKGEYVYSIQLNQNKTTPALPPAPAYNDKSQMATLKIGENTDANNSIPTNTEIVNKKTAVHRRRNPKGRALR